jgi:hypothetical protein
VCISDNITVFRPSTFFVVVHAVDGLQLEIQIVPTMQLYIKVDVSYKGQLRGTYFEYHCLYVFFPFFQPGVGRVFVNVYT